MIDSITIKNFKCIDNETLNFSPLTILTGANSSGKSTVIQGLLLGLKYLQYQSQDMSRIAQYRNLIDNFMSYDDIYNRRVGRKNVSIDVKFKMPDPLGLKYSRFDYDNNSDPTISGDSIDKNNTNTLLLLGNSFYYVSANRQGPASIEQVGFERLFKPDLSNMYSVFEQNKSEPIHESISNERAHSPMLKHQVSYWLSQILNMNNGIDAKVERIDSNFVRLEYEFEDIGSVSPFNTGTGTSFLVRLIILCLRAKPTDTIVIENPEIHLHPYSQSKLGEFFAYLAQRGIQIVIETHCEHLIHRVRYEIYKQRLNHEFATIHYKSSATTAFETIHINQGGHFTDPDGVERGFPSGFFDKSLMELLEIG